MTPCMEQEVSGECADARNAETERGEDDDGLRAMSRSRGCTAPDAAAAWSAASPISDAVSVRPGAAQPAFTTLPALMQLVQTLRRLGAPFTSARTRWMFGFQRRLVRRCECDTDMPHDGP